MPSICHLRMRGTRFKDSALGRVRQGQRGEKARPEVASHMACEGERLFHLHGAVRMGGGVPVYYDTCDPLPLTGLPTVSFLLEI